MKNRPPELSHQPLFGRGGKFLKIAKKRIGQNFHEKNCFVSSVRVSPQNLFRFGQNLSCSDKLSSIRLYFAEKQGLFLPLISTNFAQTTTFRPNYAGSAHFAKTVFCKKNRPKISRNQKLGSLMLCNLDLNYPPACRIARGLVWRLG